MRTIKGTRREELEMIRNLNLFRNACLHLNDHTINRKLKTYIEKIICGRGYCTSTKNSIQTKHPTFITNRITNIFSNQNLRFFSTCKVGNVRYTSNQYSKFKAADDSAVVFKLEDELQFGLITSIFVDEANDTMFELWPLSNATDLTVSMNNRNINLPFIQEGTLKRNNNYYYISATDIVEKCVYWRKKSNQATFFRFPNLEEGS